MKYKNKETGKVIDANSVMRGAWEPVKAPAKETEEKPAKKKKGTKK